MPRITSYKDLVVWQKAVTLAKCVYSASATFPTQERFGLVQQMRRSAVSIASNIAEGAARRHRPEFIQFLHIARGSFAELETQALIAIELGHIDRESPIATEIADVGRLLTALIRSLARDSGL